MAGVRTSPPRSRRDAEVEQYQAPRPGLSFATISGARITARQKRRSRGATEVFGGIPVPVHTTTATSVAA